MHFLIKQVLFTASITAIFSFASKADAVYPAVSLDEISQTADMVFTGTVVHLENVTSGSAVFTEATFGEVTPIKASSRSRQRSSQQVKVLYAGGEIGDQVLEVSGSPRFLAGHKYLIFMLDDGKKYLNPIVGGPQGWFEIIADPATSQEYVVSPTGKGVISITANGKAELGAAPIESIDGGKISYGKVPESRNQPQVAVSSTGAQSAGEQQLRAEVSPAPMNLDMFVKYINSAQKKTLTEKRLILDESVRGKFYRMRDGKLEAEDLGKPDSGSSEPLSSSSLVPTEDSPGQQDIRGQALVACGTHDVPLTMEQVPSGWSEYQMNNDLMANYNQFVDIFRTSASDGTFGNNSANEFGGYANNSTLSGIYGSYSWGGALGVCFTYRSSSTSCAHITQSDIFWNPAYSYTDDVNTWWNSSSVYNIRSTTVHEIGHAWGYQTGDPEQYNYDDPSVMHSVYSSVFETGRGLHATDAYIYRRHYQSLKTPATIKDIGVESYYASNGLINSTINGSSFMRGSTMNFSNVTVENMSNSSVSNLRIRFYLSTTRDFGGSYYQVGGDWTFATFNAESYSRNDYTGNGIPTNVPPGTYYVLAYVDFSGTDNYGDNNSTVFANQVTITAPTISRSPSSLSRSISQGQAASSQSFTVQNTGGGTLNYSMSVSYGTSPSGWLSLSPSSGTSTGESDTINVNYTTTALPAGTHSATITISDPVATNSGQTISVTMNVAANPTLSRTPSTITRTITAGTNASDDSFEVWNSGNTSALGYTVSDDVGWLSISPSSGSSSGSHQFHTITYSTSGLSAGSYFGTITISSPGATNPTSSIIVTMNVSAPATPVNNNLASAIFLSGGTGTVIGSNVNGSEETNEPNHAGNTGGASVWWSWTAPGTGTAVFDTKTSSFDTIMGVYTGSSYPLSLVGQDDDSGGNRTSSVTFTASSGVNYKIAVDGFNGATGSITLNRTFTAFPSEVADWSVY